MSTLKPRECICHASWSGYDEAEYRARGCPECECWKVDAYADRCTLELAAAMKTIADLRHQLEAIKAGSPKPRKGDWD